MILFENKGILDLDAMRAFGVNVKEDDSAIGYFGTGLKYALAVSLRLGLTIEMVLDRERYAFTLNEKTIRGKAFNFIMLCHPDGTKEQLGFTTELGKNWKKWMAFREFYCNAKDEGGGCRLGSIDAAAGKTVFAVDGMDDIYYEFGSYFIDDTPLVSTPQVDIHRGPCKAVFYRGIRTNDLAEPARYKYNVKSQMPLTEDRTMASSYLVEERISAGVATCDNEEVIHSVVTAPDLSFEASLRFSKYLQPSEEFMSVMKPLRHDRNVNQSAVALYKTRAGEDDIDEDNVMAPTERQQEMLQKAMNLLSAAGCSVKNNIYVVETLGKNHMGLFKDGNIYIPAETFERGMLELTITLLEERQHAVGYDDYTREYQDWLQRKLVLAWAEREGVTL